MKQTPRKLKKLGTETLGNALTQSSQIKNLSNPGTSVPFRISRDNNTADEVDFDRRSAGERFATSAYHEFMKINNIFSGALKMRRNSCSQS